MQPMELDDNGVLRFKENAIVTHLLEWAQERGRGMNEIAAMDFSVEDRRQFAQLIGYSVSGYGGLCYVDSLECAAADKMAEGAADERDARIAVLESTWQNVREGMREAIAELYGIHPDDLAP